MSGLGFPHLPDDAWRQYLSDEAGAALIARLDGHLADCADCSAHLFRTDPTRAFRALRAPAPPATWDGFWEELQPQLPAPPRRAARHGLVAAAAAAVVVAAVVIAVGRRPEPAAVAISADPCAQPAIARLKLTKAECEALFSGPIEAADDDVVVIPNVDLRGL